MNKEETDHIDTAAFLKFNEGMSILRKMVKKVQNTVYKEMNYPEDMRDRAIVLNTMNSLFDRIEDAVEAHLAETARALTSPDRKDEPKGTDACSSP